MFIIHWYIIGFLAIVIVTVMHLIIAEIDGYAALDWWDKHGTSIREQNKIGLLLGLTIWPVRILYAIFVLFPECYNLYERKDDDIS